MKDNSLVDRYYNTESAEQETSSMAEKKEVDVEMATSMAEVK